MNRHSKYNFQHFYKSITKIRPSFKNISLLIAILIIIASIFYLREAPSPSEAGVSFRENLGKKASAKHYAITYHWWVAWFFILASILFIFFNKKITKYQALDKKQKLHIYKNNIVNKKKSPFLIFYLIIAILFSSYIQIPRLNHSLWGDEEYSMRTFMVGQFETLKGYTILETKKNGLEIQADKIRFSKKTWIDVFWNYKNPNNHIYYTALAKISHTFSGLKKDPYEPYFSEILLRLPSFILSICTLIFVYYLLRSLGMIYGACFLPIYLAFHPWFNHYGSEARGYLLVFFLTIISIWLILKFLQNGSWKSTIIYAFVQHIMICTFPPVIFYTITLNIIVFSFILLSRPEKLSRSNKWALFTRFNISQLISFMLTLFIMLPNLTRLLTYLGRDRAQGEITSKWFTDVIFRLLFGIPWNAWVNDNPFCIYLKKIAHDQPILFSIALSLIIILSICGIINCIKKTNKTLAISIITLTFIPPISTILYALIQGNYLYEWYLFYNLALISITLASGFDFIVKSSHKIIPKKIKIETLSKNYHNYSLTLFSIIYSLIFIPGLKENLIQRNNPTEQNLESVLATRKIINPLGIKHLKNNSKNDQNNFLNHTITIGFMHYPRSYDPLMIIIKTKNQLIQFIKLAEKNNAKLFINFANYALGYRDHPDIMKIIENEKIFYQKVKLYGLLQPNTRHIFEYKKGGIKHIK